MRQIDNWDEIQEKQDGEYNNPAPGAYIAKIVNVIDDEKKEYLRVEWEFNEGEYAGNNAATWDRAKFWPYPAICSYKESAIGFFKGFKTSVEMSNPRYIFDTKNPQGLVGKLFGVVLGEEEYRKNDGTIGTRLYVAQKRSVKAIRDGDFKIPALKKLNGSKDAGRFQHVTPVDSKFEELEDDGPLPF